MIHEIHPNPSSRLTPIGSIPAFHVMLKPHGAVCNLVCAYCYYREKTALYPHSNHRMSHAVLEEFTRQYIHAQKAPLVTFAWQGGEPTLMGQDFYEAALVLQQKYRRPGMQITNTIQTNAVLLDDGWARFFAEHHFLVGVSLDGPPGIHDIYRRDAAGKPTSQQVIKGIRLLQKLAAAYNILTCVHAGNFSHPLKVYHYLRDVVGARYMQFIPVTDTAADKCHENQPFLDDPSAFGRFLCAIFDEWLQHDVGRVFVQHFDTALAAWLGDPAGLCVHESTCGKALVMEFNGDVYACDHFVQPAHRLGNILQVSLEEMVSSEQQCRFGNDKRNLLTEECQACQFLFACNGGCMKDRIISNPSDKHHNFLCRSYRMFFSYIDQPMLRMAALIRARAAVQQFRR